MKHTPLLVLFLVAVAVRQSASKYTTLLEDEPQQQQQDSEPSPVAAAAPADRANEPTTVSYGKLVYEQQDQNQSPNRAGAVAGPNSSNNATASGNGGGGDGNGNSTSVFSRLYSKVSSYLPFLAQLTKLRQGGTNATTSSDSELHAKTNVSVSMVRGVSRQAEDERGQKSSGGARIIGDGDENSSGSNGNDDRKENNDDNIDANLDNQEQSRNNDKQQHGMMNVKVSIDRKKTNDEDDDQNQDDENASSGNQDEQGAMATYNNFVGQFGRPIGPMAEPDAPIERQQPQQLPPTFRVGGSKRDQARQYLFENIDADSNNEDPAELDVDMSRMVPVTVGLGDLRRYMEQNEQESQQPIDASNRYNMMRQSNLVMPVGSAYDVGLTGAAASKPDVVDKQPENLLGKYIYAPTQHYYLNSVVPPQMASQQHHVLAPSGKQFQPGDHIYSSYAPDMPMKAAYSYQKEHNSIGDKPNDLYFLIMVGAFSMMATTVVLAAGLFAYRIQQSRKSSQDTGYPTYGVVGPNNMSAKCGAASIVGGYFTGPPGGGGSSKSGSARHLADLYGNAPNGAGGSDSGLNSLDKSSSNKKASSVSSLNEFHQSASSRATSNNFMAGASQDAARMYHYQHQKQQMIISDRNSGGRQTTASDLDSEDENDDGSYTVYECPGLASAHEMEIKNPLFNDDQSP